MYLEGGDVVLCKLYNVHVLYCWGLHNVIGHVCVICKSCVRALYNVCTLRLRGPSVSQ